MKKILRNLNSAAKQAMGRPRFRRGRPMACFAAEAQGASPPNNIGRGRTLSAGGAALGRRLKAPAGARANARPAAGEPGRQEPPPYIPSSRVPAAGGRHPG